MTGSLHVVGSDEAPLARSSRLLGGRVVFPSAGHSGYLLGPPPEDLDEHLERHGARPSASGHRGDRLVDLLEQVRLTGRGGGHFPAAVKWRSALRAGGGGTVVANAAEGEPASAKDAALLQHRPHLVLDGLVSAAETIGAEDVVVWVHEGAHATEAAVHRALAERRGLPEPRVRVVLAPNRYVSGEATAVVRALSGGPALPELARQPASEAGVGGRPTLVHNAETLARVALVARNGPEYRGSTLLTVLLGEHRTVLEADPGDTLGVSVQHAGWRDPQPPEAVLLGGYGGTWLDWSTASALPADEADVRRAGGTLGAGIVVPLPLRACGLVETAAVLSYLAEQSARQCGPCLFGLPSIAEVMQQLATGAARPADLRRLGRFTAEVEGRGACRHPDGGVRLARSALRVFRRDVHAHLHGGPCAPARAGARLDLPGVA